MRLQKMNFNGPRAMKTYRALTKHAHSTNHRRHVTAARDDATSRMESITSASNASVPFAQRHRHDDATRRIQEYRRRRDRRILTRSARATEQKRSKKPPPSQNHPPRLRTPSKTWIDRIDDGYWCPWWDFDAIWDWWISCCCGCCGWSQERSVEEEADDDDATPFTTTDASSAALCQPYSSNDPIVKVHIEAIAIGVLDDPQPTTNDDASEAADVSPTYNALSWVGFIPKDTSSSVTLPCKHSVEGTRVASFAKLTSSLESPTQTVPPEHSLWVVPRELDAADVAMLLAYDYPAWDQLSFGTPRRHRYAATALRGQSILLCADRWTPAIAAVVRAAVRAGARHVYVVLSTSSSTELPILRPRWIRHVTLWQEHVDFSWRSQVEGQIQRLLDYRAEAGEPEMERLFSVLDPEQGQYVVCPPPLSGGSIANTAPPVSGGMAWIRQHCLGVPTKPAVLYYTPPSDPSHRLRDLQFLLGRLSMRALRPEVDAYVDGSTLRAQAPTNVVGALLLEPWKVPSPMQGEEPEEELQSGIARCPS